MPSKIVIDIGATYTKYGYSSNGLDLGDIVIEETGLSSSEPELLLASMNRIIYHNSSFKSSEISTINIAIHGEVKGNRLTRSSRLKNYVNFDFNSLQRSMKWNIYNDAQIAALGGFLHFKKHVILPALVLTLGTGVGLSQIIDDSTIVSCDGVAGTKLVLTPDGNGQNIHNYLGLDARRKHNWESHSGFGNAEFTAAVVNVLAILQSHFAGNIPSFIVLGGASALIIPTVLNDLKLRSPSICDTRIFIDRSEFNRIVLNGLLQADTTNLCMTEPD